jgi:hypothetical protein
MKFIANNVIKSKHNTLQLVLNNLIYKLGLRSTNQKILADVGLNYPQHNLIFNLI